MLVEYLNPEQLIFDLVLAHVSEQDQQLLCGLYVALVDQQVADLNQDRAQTTLGFLFGFLAIENVDDEKLQLLSQGGSGLNLLNQVLFVLLVLIQKQKNLGQ